MDDYTTQAIRRQAQRIGSYPGILPDDINVRLREYRQMLVTKRKDWAAVNHPVEGEDLSWWLGGSAAWGAAIIEFDIRFPEIRE